MGQIDFAKTVGDLFGALGPWAYLALFGAMFIQTANPLGMALPGNPLVFALGLLAKTALGISLPLIVLIVGGGAFLGSIVGFWTGAKLGPRVLSSPRLARHRTGLEEFFARHGRRAAVLAYLVPFVRNLVPTFAGASSMSARDYVPLSAAGAFAWSALFAGAGYAFGDVPWVKDNLEVAIIAGFVYMATKGFLKRRRLAART